MDTRILEARPRHEVVELRSGGRDFLRVRFERLFDSAERDFQPPDALFELERLRREFVGCGTVPNR